MDKTTEQWKAKYLDSLENYESKERQWRDVESALRRCISRLTLAADGRSRDLDEKLERLRNSVRGERNIDRLQHMIDGIIESATSQGGKVSAAAAINAMLNQLAWPPGLGRGMKKLQKQLATRDANDHIETHVSELTGLLNEAIRRAANAADIEPADKTTKKGILVGLFARGEQESSVTTVASPSQGISGADDLDELAFAAQILDELLARMRLASSLQDEVARLRDRTRRIQTRAILRQLLTDIAEMVSSAGAMQDQQQDRAVAESAEIHEVLIQLLERLNIPDELQVRAEQLKTQWEYGIEDDKLIDAITAIADLVIEMRMQVERERGELQDFLQQLTSQLDLIEDHIQEDGRLNREAYESNRAFGRDVDGHMRCIESGMREATGLEALKKLVSDRLDAIQGHMDSFREREDQRNGEMEERVKLLNDRLQQVESESEQLRKKITREQENAIKDALTGIPNRLGWNQRFEYEYSRWRRYSTPLSLIVWDVDDFKKINDSYGHNAGDKVLITIARVFRDMIRDTDYLARFGGEEFVVLLPETPLDDALVAAEKLRTAIEACQFHHADEPVRITASGGITEFIKGDTQESVFERADKHLYAAKRAGKNRCSSDRG